MTSEDRNTPMMSYLYSMVDISTSATNPEAVSPLTPTKDLIQTGVPENTEPAVTVPPTPAQVPLPPIIGGSGGSLSTIGGHCGHSAHASRRKQARYDLTHLLSITYFTGSPLIVEAFSWRLTTISWLSTANRADLETLRLPDGSAPLPDNINNLLSLT